MAKGQDNHEKREPQLTRKAREVKEQIDEGRYDIDLAALADALLDSGALDGNDEPDHDESGPTAGSSELAQNDQEPRKE